MSKMEKETAKGVEFRLQTVIEGLQAVVTTILGYLQLLKFTDVLDITIVAFLIYKGITLLRQSSAAQVAKALLLIMAILWLAYQFNLSSVSFILSRAMELGLLALLIVFQPEIRRFLEQIGSNDIRDFWTKDAPKGALESAIVETAKAYEELSRERVGALMVFERKTSLKTTVESGTLLNAAVSSELLKNIFYPKAPLHDGAVVIRSGRVAGAGCVLPLSGNMNLSSDLGTRHRAGIGMSEKSDAVIAIVSEESGAISVAVDGRLRRHLTVENLEITLRNELLPKETEEKKGASAWLGRFFKVGAKRDE